MPLSQRPNLGQTPVRLKGQTNHAVDTAAALRKNEPRLRRRFDRYQLTARTSGHLAEYRLELTEPGRTSHLELLPNWSYQRSPTTRHRDQIGLSMKSVRGSCGLFGTLPGSYTRIYRGHLIPPSTTTSIRILESIVSDAPNSSFVSSRYHGYRGEGLHLAARS